MLPTVCILAAMSSGLMVRYEYVPMPDRSVGVMAKDSLRLGKLSEAGEFKETTRYNSDASGAIIIISAPKYTLLNAAVGPVYELRGKSLVPGRFNADFEFTPAPKGKAIPFAEYEYSPAAPPIWNLPGEFRPVVAKPDAERGVGGLDPKAVKAFAEALSGKKGGLGGGQRGGGGFAGDGTWRDRYAQVMGGKSGR